MTACVIVNLFNIFPMEINYWAVLLCGIDSMVVGFVWYGPLFGKKWAEVIGVKMTDAEECKKMQKAAGPLYGLQFLLTLFQAYVLAGFLAALRVNEAYNPPLQVALLVWAAFVMPIVAGNSMWNNDPKKVARTKFLLGAGYQLILFILFGLILGMWR